MLKSEVVFQPARVREGGKGRNEFSQCDERLEHVLWMRP